MKLMHVHAKSIIDVKMPESVLEKLPKGRWGVVTTIQHQHKIGDVLEQLESAQFAGQVLGCNASAAEKVKGQVDQWLFVGSGEFHPVQLAMMTGQPVYLWNPVAKEFGKLDKKRVDDWRKLKLGQLNKFLHAKRVGIIVTTKIGQKNLLRALELQKKGGKEYYIFACDGLDMSEFENFPFIDCWVNTACPRIPDSTEDMINIDDLIDAGILKLEKEQMAYEVPIWKSAMGLKK